MRIVTLKISLSAFIENAHRNIKDFSQCVQADVCQRESVLNIVYRKKVLNLIIESGKQFIESVKHNYRKCVKHRKVLNIIIESMLNIVFRNCIKHSL